MQGGERKGGGVGVHAVDRENRGAAQCEACA